MSLLEHEANSADDGDINCSMTNCCAITQASNSSGAYVAVGAAGPRWGGKRRRPTTRQVPVAKTAPRSINKPGLRFSARIILAGLTRPPLIVFIFTRRTFLLIIFVFHTGHSEDFPLPIFRQILHQLIKQEHRLRSRLVS